MGKWRNDGSPIGGLVWVPTMATLVVTTITISKIRKSLYRTVNKKTSKSSESQENKIVSGVNKTHGILERISPPSNRSMETLKIYVLYWHSTCSCSSTCLDALLGHESQDPTIVIQDLATVDPSIFSRPLPRALRLLQRSRCSKNSTAAAVSANQ
ncbi:hypothetical protein HAX54_015804 [Datura stramonium]|uniref:Uncharacterized protein n=1 Tax=Datura stramonium TaxID=4076 RepID=A0ABS8UIG1_DATST|nr:hypothetical protein [Datura stramonium]